MQNRQRKFIPKVSGLGVKRGGGTYLSTRDYNSAIRQPISPASKQAIHFTVTQASTQSRIGLVRPFYCSTPIATCKIQSSSGIHQANSLPEGFTGYSGNHYPIRHGRGWLYSHGGCHGVDECMESHKQNNERHWKHKPLKRAYLRLLASSRDPFGIPSITHRIVQ